MPLGACSGISRRDKPPQDSAQHRHLRANLPGTPTPADPSTGARPPAKADARSRPSQCQPAQPATGPPRLKPVPSPPQILYLQADRPATRSNWWR